MEAAEGFPCSKPEHDCPPSSLLLLRVVVVVVLLLMMMTMLMTMVVARKRPLPLPGLAALLSGGLDFRLPRSSRAEVLEEG